MRKGKWKRYGFTMRGYRSVKRRLMEEQGGLCNYCGSRLDDKAHMDHIIARACGGSDERGNLCLACPRCNSMKAHYSLRRWLDKLQALQPRGTYKHWPEWDDAARVFAISRIAALISKSPGLKKPALRSLAPPAPRVPTLRVWSSPPA
jgi:hypothetical protein